MNIRLKKQAHERLRRIDYNGIDPNRMEPEVDYCNISGRVFVDEMAFFQAAIDGNISDLIKDKVIERLTQRAEERS
ncbi:hypothetical protein J7E18_03495 [Oceanobacillus sp. ISL-73]|uniref:Uncharacterized protein n=1 Tax=Oceanobacillus kimchii TaxID=746691 RepID=A0ABQ5TG75_9BACI|nr:hypothetical protein [Oceanobacillus kimchii]MBT2650928.1 hypothetical protein [Oceanobacillus sp. ISL-73]GLO65092.1 hypothetical protein MACH08_08760 [Oceanobacillus kimchii]